MPGRKNIRDIPPPSTVAEEEEMYEDTDKHVTKTAATVSLRDCLGNLFLTDTKYPRHVSCFAYDVIYIILKIMS